MIRRLWHSAVADHILRRFIKNASYLFSANMLAAVLGFISLAVMARALGPAALGILALVETYARSVDRFVHFETWQAVVRYGAAALEKDDKDGFRRLIKSATLFDLFGAVLAAVIAVAGATLMASWLDFDQEQQRMAVLFAATLVFGLSSAPTAVLRLFDKFKLLAKLLVVVAVIRLALMLAGWLLGGDIWFFLYIMMAFQIVDQMILVAFAWWELRKRGFGDSMKAPLGGFFSSFPGIRRFVWNANINVIARTSTLQLDTLILGGLLNPAAVGLYQLAKRTGIAALRFGRPIQQAIFPDVARLWARGEIERFRRIVIRINLTMGIAGAIVLLLAAWQMDVLVRIAFGREFIEAAPLVTVQLMAVILFLAGNTLNPALLSMGADRSLTRITFAGMIVFFVLMPIMVRQFGPMGANVCHVAFNLVWLVGCLAVFLRNTRSAIAALPATDQGGRPGEGGS